MAKQTSPLALIIQRVSDDTDDDKNADVAGGGEGGTDILKRESREEGHEFTLEDHVSSSM
jgi:hypothetical protein